MSEKNLLDTIKIYDETCKQEYSLREYIDYYIGNLEETPSETYTCTEIIKLLLDNNAISMEKGLIDELIETYKVNKEELEEIKNLYVVSEECAHLSQRLPI